MEFLSVKDFLSRYQNCERRIKAKEEKIIELRGRAVSLSSAVGQGVQTSISCHGGAQSIADSYMDLVEELKEELVRLKTIQSEILQAIRSTSNKEHQELLELRYISGKTWTQIADIMCYCERQILRIHGKALEELEKGGLINPLK